MDEIVGEVSQEMLWPKIYHLKFQWVGGKSGGIDLAKNGKGI